MSAHFKSRLSPHHFILTLALLAAVLLAFNLRNAHGQGGNNPAVIVSAASFAANSPVAPDSIVSVFGARLATQLAVATSLPLPMALAGTTVRVNGEAAPLFFVSSGQAKFLIPSGTPAGTASVSVTAGDGTVSTGTVQIAAVAPGLFTANANGRGPLAAQLLRVKADGQQVYEPLAQFNGQQWVTRPIEFGPENEQLFLVLYLTGVRQAAAGQVRVSIGGVEYAPQFVGAVGGLAGLDQINAPLLRNFGGRGRISLLVKAAGATASNAGEFEIGAGAQAANAPLEITAPSQTLLAGEVLELSGSGFAANPRENTVQVISADGLTTQADVLGVTSESIRLRIPFGAGTGNLGLNWTPVNNGLPLRNGRFFANALTVIGNNLFTGNEDGVYLSTNLGQSWTRVAAGLTNTGVNSFAVIGANLFLGTRGGGVFALTDNVQSWVELNNGISNKLVNAIAVAGTNYLAGTLGSGLFRSPDQGQNWATVSGLPANANIQSVTGNGATLWAASFGDGVFRSTNQGANWAAVNNGLNNRAVNSLFLSGAALYAGTEGGVYRSTNGGDSWTLLSAGLGATPVTSFALFGGALYAGADGNGVFRLNSDGVSWTRRSNGLTSQQVRALAANGDALYAGTLGGGVCLSRDGGETWAAVNNQLPANLNVYAFAVSGRKVYAGSIYGVFVTEDEGQSWQQLNAGLLNTFVTGLAVSSEQLLASTASGGVFVSRIP